MKTQHHQIMSSLLLSATLLSTTLLGIAACSSQVMVTQYPTKQESTLSSFASYCWAADNRQESALEKIQPRGQHHTIFDVSIRAVVDKSLARKHYQKTACANAGFIIDYRMALHEDVAVVDASVTDDTSAANPYELQWRIGEDRDMTYEGMTKPEEDVITVRRGTIHIAAFSNNNTLLWHSSGEKILNERATEQEREKGLKEAVAEVMDSFPGKP